MGRISVFIIIFGVLCALGMFLIVNCNIFEDIAMKGDIQLLTVEYEWVQVAKLEPAPAGARFGKAVAISGDYIIVGAYYEDAAKGAAYIYRRSGSNWVQLTPKVTDIDGAGGDIFGDSVAISGSYAIVGATMAHKAFIFKISGSTWTQDKILNSGSANSFGKSVSISGDYAVVGAPDNDVPDPPNPAIANAGASYIFYRLSGSPPNHWGVQSQVYCETPEANSYLGYAVGISGYYVVCGAYAYEADGSGAGFIYQRNGTIWGSGSPNHENWKLNASDAAANDNFAWSVSISEGYMLIGTYNNASIYAFKWNGSDWNEIDILTADGIVVGDRFGSAVGIAGNVAVVGAYNKETGRGSAYMFKMINDKWIQEDLIWGKDSAAGDNFGYSVAVDGDYAVIGAYKHDGEAGAVYVFERRLVKK
jgi:hypothetical protein